ncbi:sensor histidine kinase [Thaumasiovibrio subtropicus]|uniref:sensor histidine kinase n=1 Tax=Thaumasiovibrio subtropicus TaxID=1891207 RepID=UPI000B34B385|nr:ATP-binding protein [Thaumasiovibrio subtropicus]
MNAMPAGVILLDPQGGISEANPEAERLLGAPLVGEKWYEIIQRSFDPKADDGHEISLRDGKKVKLAISASNSGQLILITDMTETRLLQARVSDMQRFSSLGRMVASLAHQIRTPLSSALLYAQNLGADNINAPTRQRFQGKLVDRLHDLEKQVNDMLLFAKGGDNKVVAPFSIEDLLNEVESMVDALIARHNVDFSIDCDDESQQVLGNVNALASAISNLIVNAIQVAGNECRVALHCVVKNEQLLIEVIDNGPGISAEMQEKILEPFFTTRQQGTGLGLAVVQMVAKAHKGVVTIQSQVGEGATFRLTLPLLASIQTGGQS